MDNRKILSTLLLVFIAIVMVTCSDDGPDNYNLEISGISPDHGTVGSEIEITGSGFVPKPSDNQVTFNGASAQIIKVTADVITAKVPDDATTGPVRLEISGKTVTGPSFTVNTPEKNELAVDGISPTTGPVGTEVTISGCGFNAEKSKNTVTFNGTLAEIIEVNATSSANSAKSKTDTTSTVRDNNKQAPVSEQEISSDSLSSTNCGSSIIVKVPNNATTGPIKISTDGETVTGPTFTVTDGNGGGDTLTVNAIDPTKGPAGTEVTITGTNFSATAGDNTVHFGDADAMVKSASKTELMAVVPNSLDPGAVDVTVTISGQTVTAPDQFTIIKAGSDVPTVSSIDPTEGPAGTEVTITGTNFSATTGDNTVKFGNTEATINSASETQLTAIVPTGLDPGTVDVTVTANGQTVTAPNQFTVTALVPTINAIDPTSGPVGTTVSITGTNFSTNPSEDAVTFNGTNAAVTSATETELIADVPNGATTGPVVITIGEQSATGPDFTIIPNTGDPEHPIIGSNTSLETGSRGGCVGCGFANENNIIDGNVNNYGQANIDIGVGGSIYARVESAGDIPSGGNAGFVITKEGGLIGIDLLDNITVTTFLDGIEQESASGSDVLNLELLSGSSNKQFISFTTNQAFDEVEIELGGLASISASYDIYAAYGGKEAAVVPGPSITSVSPEIGPVGTEVTITGNNFSATPDNNAVTFDGTAATVSSATATELVVKVPADATSGLIEVTTNGETATSSNDFTVGSLPLTGNDISADAEINGVLCGGCSASGGDNVINDDADDFAKIKIALGVAANGTVTIENNNDLQGGGKAGFIISREGGVVNLSLLDNITITTSLNGTVQESLSGSGLLLADLLNDSSTPKEFVGLNTTKDFDKIEIKFGGLASASITYNIYSVYSDYFKAE